MSHNYMSLHNHVGNMQSRYLTSWVIDGLGLPLQYQRQHGGQPAYYLAPGVHQVPQLSVCGQTLCRKTRDTISYSSTVRNHAINTWLSLLAILVNRPRAVGVVMTCRGRHMLVLIYTNLCMVVIDF